MTLLKRNPILLFVSALLFTSPAQSFAESALSYPPPAVELNSLYLPKELWDMIFQMAGHGADVSARTASKAFQQRADHSIGQRGLDLSYRRTGALSENQLKEIFARSAILFPDLRELNLAYQVLSEDVLVAMKKAFPRLKILRLNNATINSAGLSELLNRPGDDLNPLEVLDLSYAEGELAGPLKNYLGSRASANLKELILSGNLPDFHVNEILEALASREHKELKTLSFPTQKDPLNPEVFAQVLRTHPQIKSLDIVFPPKNPQLDSQLLNLLKSTNLEELSLGILDHDAHIASLTEFIRESKNLKKLAIFPAGAPSGAAALGQALIQSATLQELKIVDLNVHFLPTPVAAMANHTEKNETLRTLKISGKIGWEGMVELLKICPKLEELKLSGSAGPQEEEGIASFIPALSQANLKKVDLGVSRFSQENLLGLLITLFNHKSIQSVKLRGAADIVPALTQFSGVSPIKELRLPYIGLFHNRIELLKKLVAPESHFPQLRILYLLIEHDLKFDHLKEIHDVLKKNRTLEKIYLRQSSLPDLSKIQANVPPEKRFKSWREVDPRISFR